MTTETTAPPADSTAAPVVDTRPPPKSDAEAALREAEAATAKDPAITAATLPEDGAAKPEGEQPKASEQKKNRTGIYINRLQEENRRLREQVASNGATPQARQVPAADTRADDEPTLEQFDYDIEKYTRAHSQWAVQNHQKQSKADADAASERESQQKMFDTYSERLAAFEAEHPDFQEAVNSIEYDLSKEVGVAILGHERGPEIAYYIANNDDEAFTLANTLPQNAAAAVARLVKRMDAAQQASQPEPAAASAVQPVAAATPAAKPISKAPAPTPTLSGRTPGEVPPEKMTDDQWYAKERERQRKR